MKLLLDKDKLIVLMLIDEVEVEITDTHIKYNNCTILNQNSSNSELITDIEELPEDILSYRYKYIEGEFIPVKMDKSMNTHDTNGFRLDFIQKVEPKIEPPVESEAPKESKKIEVDQEEKIETESIEEVELKEEIEEVETKKVTKIKSEDLLNLASKDLDRKSTDIKSEVTDDKGMVQSN